MISIRSTAAGSIRLYSSVLRPRKRSPLIAIGILRSLLFTPRIVNWPPRPPAREKPTPGAPFIASTTLVGARVCIASALMTEIGLLSSSTSISRKAVAVTMMACNVTSFDSLIACGAFLSTYPAAVLATT